MKLIPIFVNNETKEGLYAVHYGNENCNEFERLFNLWTDAQYIRNYLNDNIDYLQAPFFKQYLFSDLETKIFREAQDLRIMFLDFEDDFFENNAKLQEIFRPLSDSEHTIPVHQSTKSSIYNWKYLKALLRFYAIRIGNNTYVITGGAIKLVKKMESHPDTSKELKKLRSVKKYLVSLGLECDDDLNFCL